MIKHENLVELPDFDSISVDHWCNLYYAPSLSTEVDAVKSHLGMPEDEDMVIRCDSWSLMSDEDPICSFGERFPAGTYLSDLPEDLRGPFERRVTNDFIALAPRMFACYGAERSQMNMSSENPLISDKPANPAISFTFGELRPFISRIDRLSLCRVETLQYDNFLNIRQVPESYDCLYVYGIGMIDSEFATREAMEDGDTAGKSASPNFKALKEGRWEFTHCIEILLGETPHNLK